MVSVKALKKYFTIKQEYPKRSLIQIKAADDVTFDIDKGKTLGLVGESGCGKTTVARILLGLIRPDSGQVVIDGKDIFRIKKRELNKLRQRFQIVFQDPFDSLNPKMRIGDSIIEGPRIHRLVKGRREQEKLLLRLLDMVGLPSASKDKKPHQFSSGQRQRICIARALSLEPEFIILDEPTSNLDVSIQAQILNLLVDLKKRLNLTYLFISHNLSIVKFISDEICVMRDGKIVEKRPKGELYESAANPYTKTLIDSIFEPDPRTARQKILVKRKGS